MFCVVFHSTQQIFVEHLMCTMLDLEDTAVNKINKNPAFMGMGVTEMVKKYMNEIQSISGDRYSEKYDRDK